MMLMTRAPFDEELAHVPEEAARDDLRHPPTLLCGRHSTPVEVILRLLIAKHLSQWSFQETQERVNESLVLRWFCRVYFRRMPDDTTLIRWAQLIRPETLHALNDRVVELATQAKVIKGRWLAQKRSAARGYAVCEKLAQKLHRLVRRAEAGEKQQEQQAEQQRMLSQQLINSTEQMVQQARQVTTSLLQQAEKSAQHLVEKVEPLLPMPRACDRPGAHACAGRQAGGRKPTKCPRSFEPHTRIIPRNIRSRLSLGGKSNSGARGRRDCDTLPDWRRIPMSMDKGSRR
jgi:IS5 family transposase